MPAWAPLTRPGLPSWRPGALPVFQLYALERGESLDVGWVPAHDFSYIMARLFRTLGLNGITALKASLMVGMLLLGLATFAWSRRLWGDRAGILAAMLVVYAPVFLSSLYIVGATGAVWLLLGVSVWGWAWFLNGWRRWLGWFVGAPLTMLSAITLLRASSHLQTPTINLLFEAPWFWATSVIQRQTPLAWSPGLPLLALAIMASWLMASLARKEGMPHRRAMLILTPVAWLLLFSATALPVGWAWLLILVDVALMAIIAASLLALQPLLKTPAQWAALLIMPLLAAGPALSPTFQRYPIPEQPVAWFGPKQILLIDAQMPSPPEPGSTLVMDAYWQATQPIDFDYNIFIHVIDDAGRMVTQLDTQPQLGGKPMTSWQVGEVIPDQYTLNIPADAPASLHVRLGLYNWQTGERLRLSDGADAITFEK